jgi:homoserine/homoserine lactone efflux protein
MTYGLFADWIAQKFKGQIANNLDKISGSFLIGAAVLLSLKKVDV